LPLGVPDFREWLIENGCLTGRIVSDEGRGGWGMGTLGIRCGGFGFGMKKSPASFVGGGWFGFEGFCATLLARAGGYAHSV